MPRQLVARPTGTPTHAPPPQNADSEALRQTSEALRRARAVRQLVDRAKSLLMSQEGLSEQEAFRLALCRATQIVLAQSLELVGVDAPERM